MRREGNENTGRTEVLVRVPPVRGAGGGAASAENALVETIEEETVLVGLEVLDFVGLVIGSLLSEPGLDGGVLLVEVGEVWTNGSRGGRHTGDEVSEDEHVRKRTNGGGAVVLLDLGEASETVLAIDIHGARTANTLTAGTRNEGESRKAYRRKTRVGSCSFLILRRPSRIMVPQLDRVRKGRGNVLIHVNDKSLIVGLVVLLGIVSVDLEDLVLLLEESRMTVQRAYRLRSNINLGTSERSDGERLESRDGRLQDRACGEHSRIRAVGIEIEIRIQFNKEKEKMCSDRVKEGLIEEEMRDDGTDGEKGERRSFAVIEEKWGEEN